MGVAATLPELSEWTLTVHFCSLGMKTYRFQVMKSQVTLHEQLLNKTGLECFYLRSLTNCLRYQWSKCTHTIMRTIKMLTYPRLLVILSRTQMLKNFLNP